MIFLFVWFAEIGCLAPRTQDVYVAEYGPKLLIPLPLSSLVRGLHVCAATVHLRVVGNQHWTLCVLGKHSPELYPQP